MSEFILKHWLQVLFGMITAAIATGYRLLFVRMKKDKGAQRALQEGVMALLSDRLIQMYNIYKDMGHCPIYARSSAAQLYRAYHELGGNGTMTDLYNKLLAMPTEKEEGK